MPDTQIYDVEAKRLVNSFNSVALMFGKVKGKVCQVPRIQSPKVSDAASSHIVGFQHLLGFFQWTLYLFFLSLMHSTINFFFRHLVSSYISHSPSLWNALNLISSKRLPVVSFRNIIKIYICPEYTNLCQEKVAEKWPTIFLQWRKIKYKRGKMSSINSFVFFFITAI